MLLLSHWKQSFSGSQGRVHFSVTTQIFDPHLSKEIGNKQNTKQNKNKIATYVKN